MTAAERVQVPSQRLSSPKYLPRLSRREPDGMAEDAAEAILGAVRAGVVTPDGRILLERRGRERRGDKSLAVWLPVGEAPLRSRFPHGALVRGPFVTLGRMRFDLGEGMVDWTRRSRWAVPSCAVPVEVVIGNRWSGGYLPEELEVIPPDAEPVGFTT